MARGKSLQIELNETERQTLEMWLRAAKTEKRYTQRAQAVLLSAQGEKLPEISRRSGLSRQNCSRWRKRFQSLRIDGLMDLPRKGRPLVISPETRTRVTKLACTKPTDGSNQWTIQSLAKAVGIGRTSVHRILATQDLKPHKVEYWCGKSPDPEFEEKQAAILALYLNPPENALVLCVDEKSQIQALDRTQPELPLWPGNPRRLTATYKRHGTTCLLAALSVHDGKVTGRWVDSNNHSTFLGFLKNLYRSNPRKQLHIIMDNLSLHEHSEVTDWIRRRRRLTIHFTPTYASWLSQIEIWFHIFSRDVIRGGVWKSKSAMVQQIMEYVRQYSKHRAHPFAWTYTGKTLTA